MRINVAVLYGSRTCEHDVSVISGLQAAGALDAVKFNVIHVYIARDGAWYVGERLRDIEFYTEFDPKQVTRVVPSGTEQKLVLTEAEARRGLFAGAPKVVATADVVMPVFHGMNGEDGSVQGMLELWNIPYTSSGMLGCAVGMDKIAMKQLFRGCGFPVLPGTWVDRDEWKQSREACVAKVEQELAYPVYVKPANLGSSIGISRANDREGLIRAMEIAVSYDRRILIEKGVTKIKEVNCSVLGYAGQARASVLEMPMRWDDEDLLSFAEKYLRAGKTGAKGMQALKRQIPAPIGEELTEKIRALSVDVFRALDSKGVVRIDYIIDEDDGAYYVGEINTIPGSLAFYLWEPVGISFSQMLEKMIEYAYLAHADKNKSVFSFDSTILKNMKLGTKQGAK